MNSSSNLLQKQYINNTSEKEKDTNIRNTTNNVFSQTNILLNINIIMDIFNKIDKALKSQNEEQVRIFLIDFYEKYITEINDIVHPFEETIFKKEDKNDFEHCYTNFQNLITLSIEIYLNDIYINKESNINNTLFEIEENIKTFIKFTIYCLSHKGLNIFLEYYRKNNGESKVIPTIKSFLKDIKLY